MDTFNWNESFFICTNQASLDPRHWDRETVIKVHALTLK